jgi:hypothetical protein
MAETGMAIHVPQMRAIAMATANRILFNVDI